MIFKYLDLSISVDVNLDYREIQEDKITYINSINVKPGGMSILYDTIDPEQIELIPETHEERHLIYKNDPNKIKHICCYHFDNNLIDDFPISHAIYHGLLQFSEDCKFGTHSLEFLGVNALDIHIEEPLNDTITLSFWFNKKFGLDYLASMGNLSVKTNGTKLGFTTENGDLCYTDIPAELESTWIHVGIVICNYNPQKSKIYINGELQTLTKNHIVNVNNWSNSNIIRLGGKSDTNAYRMVGKIDYFRLFNYELSNEEIQNELLGASCL